MIQILNGDQRAYRGEGFSALFTFCPNCPAIISPRILGKIGAVVGVPRACQKFWGFFCLVVCSSLPDGSGRLMEGPTWQTQNVNKAEKHTPKVDAACVKSCLFFHEGMSGFIGKTLQYNL